MQHYAFCPAVREFGSRFCRSEAPVGSGAMDDFLVLEPRYSEGARDVLVRKAVRLAAVYIVHCRFRHGSSPAPVAWQALSHMAREILRGSSAATRCFARAWAPLQ